MALNKSSPIHLEDTSDINTTRINKHTRLNVNLDVPRWDQSTFQGRLRYYFWVTDPRTAFVSKSKLLEAKSLLDKYKSGLEPPGTTEQQLWYAKKLYSSAFHPDSGELGNVLGRMSFQVPGGMIITGCLLQFYRTTFAVVSWQWVNQSFNALVNYTNRNAQSGITNKQIGIAYVSATTSAVITAIGLKSLRAPPLLHRYVPFAAVAAANMVNIPLMRQSELIDGIAVFDENGNRLTESRYAAAKGISQVVFSRIFMAMPGMTMLPLIMERLEQYSWMKQIKVLHAPIQILIVGVFLTFMTPTACSLFPQRASIKTERLKWFDKDKYDKLKQSYADKLPDRLYFNKGL